MSTCDDDLRAIIAALQAKAFDDDAALTLVERRLDRLDQVAQAIEVLVYDQDVNWQMLNEATPLLDDSLAEVTDLLGDLDDLMDQPEVAGDAARRQRAEALSTRAFAALERLREARVEMIRALGEIGRAGWAGAPVHKHGLASL